MILKNYKNLRYFRGKNYFDEDGTQSISTNNQMF